MGDENSIVFPDWDELMRRVERQPPDDPVPEGVQRLAKDHEEWMRQMDAQRRAERREEAWQELAVGLRCMFRLMIYGAVISTVAAVCVVLYGAPEWTLFVACAVGGVGLAVRNIRDECKRRKGSRDAHQR